MVLFRPELLEGDAFALNGHKPPVLPLGILHLENSEGLLFRVETGKKILRGECHAGGGFGSSGAASRIGAGFAGKKRNRREDGDGDEEK